MWGCVLSRVDFSTCLDFEIFGIERVWVGTALSKNLQSDNRPSQVIFFLLTWAWR